MENTHKMNKSEYAKGGAIYKGDKVRIKDSNKSMVVKNIAKGKKGYVEFSGDAGTYLKGDLEKMAKGGSTFDYYDGSGAKDITELGLDDLKFQLKHKTKLYEKERVALLKKLIAQKESKKMAKGGKMYAKGGMTAHGLKVGDKITADKGKNSIEIYNKSKREDGYVDLDAGERRTHKYAKGGGVGDDLEWVVEYLMPTEDNYRVEKGFESEEQARRWVKGERIDKEAEDISIHPIKKFAEGGSIKVNLGSGEMDLEDAIKMYENKIKSQGRVTNERDENMLKQLKSMRPKMAKGGKTKSKQDPPVIRGYVDDEPYEYGDGGTMNCWCYEIGGL